MVSLEFANTVGAVGTPLDTGLLLRLDAAVPKATALRHAEKAKNTETNSDAGEAQTVQGPVSVEGVLRKSS